MSKTITTGTEITFTRTKDIFELTKTATGFDVKPVKLSKSRDAEPYTFQELLDLFESGKITIEGFEEADSALVKSILTNYIHTTEIEALKAEIEAVKTEIDKLKEEKKDLELANLELIQEKNDLASESSQLKTTNQELTASNNELAQENKSLKATNQQLNSALEAMQEEAK